MSVSCGKLPHMTPAPSPTNPASPYGPAIGVNAKAIWSLPLSVAFSLVGVVLAHVARAEIRRNGERGDGIAKAALIIGYAVMAVWTIFWLALILAVFPTA